MLHGRGVHAGFEVDAEAPQSAVEVMIFPADQEVHVRLDLIELDTAADALTMADNSTKYIILANYY